MYRSVKLKVTDLNLYFQRMLSAVNIIMSNLIDVSDYKEYKDKNSLCRSTPAMIQCLRTLLCLATLPTLHKNIFYNNTICSFTNKLMRW